MRRCVTCRRLNSYHFLPLPLKVAFICLNSIHFHHGYFPTTGPGSLMTPPPPPPPPPPHTNIIRPATVASVCVGSKQAPSSQGRQYGPTSSRYRPPEVLGSMPTDETYRRSASVPSYSLGETVRLPGALASEERFCVRSQNWEPGVKVNGVTGG